MKIYAAIHISNGRSVNPNDLHYSQNSIITNDPVKLALHWQEQGASMLHLIDLDAASMGYPVNGETIQDIVDTVSIPVQYGGGLRTIKDIDNYLNMGVSRVIIGTQAIQDPRFLKEAASIFGADKILVGIDADRGMAVSNGREKITNFNVITLAKQAELSGIRTVIYTDVVCAKEVRGPHLDDVREFIEKTHMDVIISGGIASLSDIRDIQELNAHGVILGAALYTNKIHLTEAVSTFERGA